jgi:hypothetical protein
VYLIPVWPSWVKSGLAATRWRTYTKAVILPFLFCPENLSSIWISEKFDRKKEHGRIQNEILSLSSRSDTGDLSSYGSSSDGGQLRLVTQENW